MKRLLAPYAYDIFLVGCALGIMSFAIVIGKKENRNETYCSAQGKVRVFFNGSAYCTPSNTLSKVPRK